MKRIYSLNLACWLIMRGYKYELVESEEHKGKYYFVFVDDITEAKSEYQNNEELHNFLEVYKRVKKEINKRRSENR